VGFDQRKDTQPRVEQTRLWRLVSGAILLETVMVYNGCRANPAGGSRKSLGIKG